MARGKDNALRTLQGAFVAGEISPRLHGRMELPQYATGIALCRNFVISPYGGARNRPGTKFIAYAGDETRRPRLIPFRFSLAAGQAYALEFGHNYIRFYMNGARVLYSSGPSVGLPVSVTTTYTEAQLHEITYVQSGDVMTLTHPSHPVRTLTRTAHDAWALAAVTFAPSLTAPAASDVTLTIGGAGVGTNYSYQVTYETESGEESLPSATETIAHGSSLSSTNYIDVAITYPYPANVVYANVYKYRGGTYGWIGATSDGTLRDDNIAPDLSSTPPRARNPFSGSGDYPGAVAYYQQRQAFAGTDDNPETVWLSQTGAFRNFTTSEPLRDSDAITATLVGEQVDDIRHLVSMSSLVILTRGGLWTLRRGDNGLTPALEGGLHFESAFGSSAIRPLVIGGALVYVQEGSRVVRAAEFDLGRDGLAVGDVGLLAEHLLRDSAAYEWAWAQNPDSLIWVAREDGTLLSVGFMKDQEVFGWSQHETAGTVESVATIPEDGEDALYLVVRRRLGGSYRRCVERMASRNVTDVRDGFFVDCGLSLNSPITISSVTVGASYVEVTAASHGLSNSDWIDITGIVGLDGLNDRRLVAGDVAANTFRVYQSGADLESGVDTYLPPSEVTGTYLSGGVVRKAVSSVTGLTHLNGEEVSVLADGSVEGPYTVSGGSITLLRPASRVHAGLGYVADLQTLPIPGGAELRERLKRITQVSLFLESSRGVFIGPSVDALEEFIQRADELLGDPTSMTSGVIELTVPSTWNRNGQLWIRQADPLPIEVLAVVPAFEVGSQ